MKTWVALILVACTALPLALADLRDGLASQFTPSPDGASLVCLSERRKGRRGEYTITLVEGARHGSPTRVSSLTPRYGPFVASPSGKAVAYWGVDFGSSCQVFVFGEDLRWDLPHVILPPSSGVEGGAVEWSADGAYVRFHERVRLLGQPSWQVRSVYGKARREEWEVEGLEWPEPVLATGLPDFLTQEQPSVSRNMPLVWARDSKAVFVADGTGVWRATLAEPYTHIWNRIADLEHVRGLAMSPSGGHLVAECGTGEEGPIHEITLGTDGVTVEHVADGWGVRFSATDDDYYYGSYLGFYAKTPGGRRRGILPASWQ
jgi:hypothetical protein